MITLFGIKNCDTVKKARRWLEVQSIDYRFHDIRADGLHQEQVAMWLETIGVETLVNKRSTTWKGLSDDDKASLSAKTAVQFILEHPTLMKRPLLEVHEQEQQTQVHVGFKDAQYQALFA